MNGRSRLAAASVVVVVFAQLPAQAAETPPTPGARLLRTFGGHRCALERKDAAVGLPGEFDPDADPGAQPTPPPPRYEPTEAAVFRTCGGLGCVDDPASQNPLEGVCSLPRTAADCAGAAEPSQHQGLCGPAHEEPLEQRGIVGRRFMFTAQGLVEFGPDLGKSAEVDTAIGGLFQLSFTRSKVRPLLDGGTEHYDLPAWYFHVETHLSKQRFGHELGIVYKLNNDTFSRLGLTAYGIVWGVEQFVERPRYRLGPAVHVELLNNLLLRGAFTPGIAAEGPSWVISAEYAANLWDDFKR